MNKITLWFKVKKLQKLCDINHKEFKKAEKHAKEKNISNNDMQALIHEYSFEYQIINDDIMDLNTRYLSYKAQKLLLPLPDFQDETNREKSSITGIRNFTNKGISQLRSDIRKEVNERRNGIFLWIVACTGIIGAVTGLVAVIKSNL